MSVRTERVGALLRDELGALFQRRLPDYLDGMVTIVSVKMSPDLRIAKVYVSLYRNTTDRDILIKRLNTHAPELRAAVAARVTMRFMPELRFYRDDTLDAAEQIDRLLAKVRADDEARGYHPHVDEPVGEQPNVPGESPDVQDESPEADGDGT